MSSTNQNLRALRIENNGKAGGSERIRRADPIRMYGCTPHPHKFAPSPLPTPLPLRIFRFDLSLTAVDPKRRANTRDQRWSICQSP